MNDAPKRVLIIGATSGIGEAIAREAHRRGYVVGLSGRRRELLENISSELGNAPFEQLDVTDIESSRLAVERLAHKLGGIDVFIANAGVTASNVKNDWGKDAHIFDVNVMGFSSMCNWALNYFAQQGHGHLMGISSVAAYIFSARSVAYSASKAFASMYMHGLRARARAIAPAGKVWVTDVKPGFIETPLIQNVKAAFWVVSAELAAKQIVNHFNRRKRTLFVPKRWWWVSQIVRRIPYSLLERVKA